MVDGEWTTDPTAPKEKDDANNENNYLLPENIFITSGKTSGVGGAVISGITPGSTTAQLAANVPKESGHARNESVASDVPGSFPETPFHDAQEFSVNPIPATSGAGNPVSLKPGEKVPDPSTITTNNTTTADTLDKKSYEKAGSAQPPPSSKPETDAFSLPPVGKGVIPESSLPMGGDVPSSKDTGPIIQSSGAGTSTAALAANVPKEPRGAPEVISETQQRDGTGPKASDKDGVGESKASKDPATSDPGVLGSGHVPPSVQESINEYNKGVPVAPTVPDVVQESIAESKTAPEAAASEQVVGEKSAVESELLKDVKPTNATGEPAPATTAALTDKAPEPTDSKAPVTSAEAPAQTPATQSSMAEAIRGHSAASRDISPLSHPTGQKPIITTGVASSSAPAKSAPSGAAAAPASPASKTSATASTDKKSKRSSGFFGKIKDKLKHHDK